MKKFIASYFLLLSVTSFVLGVGLLITFPFVRFFLEVIPLGLILSLLGGAGIIVERIVERTVFKSLAEETRAEKRRKKEEGPYLNATPLSVVLEDAEKK